jgi:hypothetical protein
MLSNVVLKYGTYSVSSSDSGTWYPHQASKFLKINHHLYPSYEKSIIERTIHCIKDRTLNALMTTFHVEKRNVN